MQTPHRTGSRGDGGTRLKTLFSGGVGEFAAAGVLVTFVAACSATSGAATTNGDGGALGTGSGSCAQTISGGAGITLRFCTDYAGLTADQEGALRSVCMTRPDAGTSTGDAGTSFAGTFGASSCDRTDALGGCRVAFGGFMQTTWYYRGGVFMDESVVRSSCVTANGTWVAP